MSTVNIFVRQIENGYIVGGGHPDLLGRGNSERYFATFDELRGEIGGIIEAALAAADEADRMMADERKLRSAALNQSNDGAMVGGALRRQRILG